VQSSHNFELLLHRDLPTTIPLVLKKNVLSSGYQYKFGLKVRSRTNLSAIVAEATTYLATPSKPIAGKIEVNFEY